MTCGTDRSHAWRARALALLVPVMLASACSSSDSSSVDEARPREDEGTPPTPAGETLRWLVDQSGPDAELTEQEYEARFDDAYRSQVGLDEVASQLTRGRLQVDRVRLGQTPHHLTAEVRQSDARMLVDISVSGDDAEATVEALRLRPLEPLGEEPPPELADWGSVDARLQELASDAALTVAEARDGECHGIHGLETSTPMPLASTIKLWVLGALAEQVRDGTIGWDDEVAVRDELRSLTGVVRDEPTGTRVTVADLAALMISISDNTATDHLIDLVGRDAVEQQLEAFGMTDPTPNRPLITTAEMFALRMVDHPSLVEQWRQADEAGRRKLLDDPRLADRELLKEASFWGDARWPEYEWMATTDDLCRALAGLHELADDPDLAILDEILRMEDLGLGLDPTTWPSTWFKGGSEPGVLTLAFLATHEDGRTVAVVTAVADGEVAFQPEPMLTTDLVPAVRAAYDLAAGP